MDTDRLLFLFTCLVSFLFCVTPVPLAALKKAKYLEPAAIKDGELNDPCRVNNDCGTFGYFCATNKTCQCEKQYRPNYQTKLCLGGIDQKCQYDEHCIEGAYCMSQSNCQCKENWPYGSLDGMECSNGITVHRPLENFILGSIILIYIT